MKVSNPIDNKGLVDLSQIVTNLIATKRLPSMESDKPLILKRHRL